MKLHRVEWLNAPKNEKQVYVFETADSAKKVLTAKGERINSLLEFCFGDDEKTQLSCSVFFSIASKEYTLKKENGEKGSKAVLRVKEDGSSKVVARGKNIKPHLDALLQEQIDDLLKLDYISATDVASFHGNLDFFEQYKILMEVWDKVRQSSLAARRKGETAFANMKAISKETVAEVSEDEIERLTAKINDTRHSIYLMQGKLAQMRSDNAIGAITNEILQELSVAQTNYQKLQSESEAWEAARTRLKNRDAIATIVPSIRTLEKLSTEKAQHERERHQIVSELEWVENELASVNAQITKKQKQTSAIYDKRSRSEVVNQELQNITELYERNKTLNEYLGQLNEQNERLLAEKAVLKNKMSNVELAIEDIKKHIDEFKLPNKSIGELLETVRVDVKLDEIQSQIEKLQSEIAVKESQVAEKESNLVLQVRKFKSVAELDVSIAPIKAKDTILQVLDGKLTKLEMVNDSLKEKERNLTRAYEDYKHKLIAVEQAKSQLEAKLEKTLYKKQEEFKREVYLNSQKIYTNDDLGVFAVTANFSDEEILTLKKQVADRSNDSELLHAKANRLSGQIQELKRQMDINEAEMATLRKEKSNILARYNEIISQNRSETVFNYLKALESNNGTKYLLDVQQDAVKNEAELAQIKKEIAVAKNKLTSLQGRERYLKEAQRSLDNTEASLDHLIQTNDQVKGELSDIGTKLSANYEQYSAISAQAEELDEKLARVNEMLVETKKTIKLNERQIAASQEKADKFADGQDLQKVLQDAKLEVADVESERLLLLENKSNLEKDIFKKRLELEKAQWIYDTKSAEYDEIKEKVQFELNLKGISVEQVESVNFEEDSEKLRADIQHYDNEKNALRDKIENLYSILQQSQPDGIPPIDKDLTQKITDLQAKIELMQSVCEQLEKTRSEQLSLYMSASDKRMKIAVATAEAQTLAELRHTLAHNSVVDALLSDKFKEATKRIQQYARVLTGKNYTFSFVGDSVSVSLDEKKIEFGSLEKDDRVLIYIAVLLSVPNTDVTEGRWLLFDDKLPISKTKLSNAVLRVKNIDYLTECNVSQMTSARK